MSDIIPNLEDMTDAEKKAALDAIQLSIAKSKEVQKQRIGENVNLVIDALKKIESDIQSRYDLVGNTLEKRVASIKDGKDGKDGRDGKNGKDGRDGKQGVQGAKGENGRDGRDGVDGSDGVGVSFARIDFDGSLVIGLSSGVELNVGEVVAPDLAERIKVITNGGGTSQSVLDTLASLQTQINNLIPSQTGNAGKYLTTNGTVLSWASVAGGGLSYQGTWNASTNTPTLVSSTGVNGYYYITSTAGSTNLDGITDWQIGDWLIFNGTVWQKIDQSNLVTSVAGRTGAITLANTDISGLGTMSTQNASSVAITGGTINGTTIGATTATTGAFTTLTVNDNATFGSSNTDTATFNSRINSDFDPATNNAFDLGRVGHEWRDLYIDGTANIDSLIADTADINAGTIDNTTIGATTPQNGSFVNLSATGTTTLSGKQIISVTDNSNAALRITQLGTGNALLVEDSTNPDSTPFVIDANGKVVIGNTSAFEYTTGATPAFQVLGTSAVTSTAMIGRFSADGNGAPLILVKSRGAIGSQGAVISGDIVANMQMWASDGTSNIQMAGIQAVVDGTPGTNDMPGRLVFSTTADGASSPTERVRITSTGAVAFSGASNYGTSGQVLQSNGNAAPTWTTNISGNAANVTGTVAVANGGTGQTTATLGFNALAPSQTSNSGKYLTTDGTNSSWATVSADTVGFKNRIINGAMVIDQRNAGASINSSTNGAFSVDRWGVQNNSGASRFTLQQNAGSVTPPAGFANYLGITSTSAYSIANNDACATYQNIEAYNIADLAWGTASAQPITLSFWVRSSLTGTFGGALQNSGGSRTHPFSYTISSANTWEQKSITIAGETTGTWLTTNGIGVVVMIGLGVGSSLSGTAGAWSSSNFFSATGATSVVGTSGATLYITGVQLEKGSTATSFDYRPYGTELLLCQRYLTVLGGSGTSGNNYYGIGLLYSTNDGLLQIPLPVVMRSAPTFSFSSLANWGMTMGTVSAGVLTAMSLQKSNEDMFTLSTSGTSGGLTTNYPFLLVKNSTASRMYLSAEL